jgi:hypothetical protein
MQAVPDPPHLQIASRRGNPKPLFSDEIVPQGRARLLCAVGKHFRLCSVVVRMEGGL